MSDAGLSIEGAGADALHFAVPEHANGTGVLVLSGSSGRLESARADLLAATGATVLALRWFGGRGQRSAPHEVPLELFSSALDVLAGHSDRLVVLGTSFGAEAALLTASLDPRVDAMVAIAPTPVVWAGYAESDGSDGWSSHWTRAGVPVPYVSFLEDWSTDADPPEYRELYASSLAAAGEAVRTAATIPVERIRGDVLLVVGGDDRVWPSTEFAGLIADRRRAYGLDTEIVMHPDAGHRLVLPGEEQATGGTTMGRGGSDAADRELGELAWSAILRLIS